MDNAASIVIIGLGNDYRGDDAIGLYTARLLVEKGIPGLKVIEGVSDGTTLIHAWQDAPACYLVDCVFSQNKPGHIHRFDALTDVIPEEIFPGYSTHAFSITGAVKLARALNQLPKKLVVYGIEGASFATGKTITLEVERAARKVRDLILEEIEKVK